jgi:hypothetical protein
MYGMGIDIVDGANIFAGIGGAGEYGAFEYIGSRLCGNDSGRAGKREHER